MSKEQNIKVYNKAYEYLLSIKPEGVELDNYFYGDSKNFKSLILTFHKSSTTP